MARNPEDENKHLLDLDSLIDQVISQGLDPGVFDVDLDVKFAKNVIDFAVSPEFMDSAIWAKQAEQAVRLFAEYCPNCSDKDFLDDVPVDASVGTFRSKIVLLEHGICPVCSKNKCELFERHPWELVSCLGQRSGKTALTGGIVSPYYVHKFLELKNPTRFYGTMSNAFFEMTFVAVTAGQVKKTLWMSFKEAIHRSPWFKDYIAKLKAAEKEKGFDKGTLVKVMDSAIWFGNKQLACSYAAADMKSLRGSTRVFSSIDELAWFNQNPDASRANADETYAALSNSLRTVRSACDRLWRQGEYRALPGMMVNISSPSSMHDKMMSLLREGEHDKRKLCFHLATWEATPSIPRYSLESEEQNNPIKFWRDFGAQPPLADSPFIESMKAIEGMETKSRPLVSWRVKYIKDKVDHSRTKYIAAELMGMTSDSRSKMVPRCITVDCGETQNSFAIGIYHMEQVMAPEGLQTQVICDAVIEAKPQKIIETGELIPVHFPTMFNIIEQLCDRTKGFNVRGVIYDRWQSTSQIQALRDMKIRAEKRTPREADFKALRSLVYAGNFKMPKWELDSLTDLDVNNIEQVRLAPYTNMAVQFATVREVGLKVTKPEAGDDDLFRTAVGATWFMMEHQKDFITRVAASGSESQRPGVGSVRYKSGPSFQGTRSRTTIGTVRVKSAYRMR